MRRNLIAAIAFSLTLSACSTYPGADGRTHFGDPVVCRHSGSDSCLLVVAAIATGCLVAVAAAQ